MQILHCFVGSIQKYSKELSDLDRYRPDHCPQCEANRPLTAHGSYCRTLADVEFDESIRVRRYLCRVAGVRCHYRRSLLCRTSALGLR